MMNLVWALTGVLLFGGMIAGGISLYLKRRKEEKMELDKSNEFRI
jgi:LPXTG-motif cell wall-anchored protein